MWSRWRVGILVVLLGMAATVDCGGAFNKGMMVGKIVHGILSMGFSVFGPVALNGMKALFGSMMGGGSANGESQPVQPYPPYGAQQQSMYPYGAPSPPGMMGAASGMMGQAGNMMGNAMGQLGGMAGQVPGMMSGAMGQLGQMGSQVGNMMGNMMGGMRGGIGMSGGYGGAGGYGGGGYGGYGAQFANVRIDGIDSMKTEEKKQKIGTEAEKPKVEAAEAVNPNAEAVQPKKETEVADRLWNPFASMSNPFSGATPQPPNPISGPVPSLAAPQLSNPFGGFPTGSVGQALGTMGSLGDFGAQLAAAAAGQPTPATTVLSGAEGIAEQGASGPLGSQAKQLMLTGLAQSLEAFGRMPANSQQAIGGALGDSLRTFEETLNAKIGADKAATAAAEQQMQAIKGVMSQSFNNPQDLLNAIQQAAPQLSGQIAESMAAARQSFAQRTSQFTPDQLNSLTMFKSPMQSAQSQMGQMTASARNDPSANTLRNMQMLSALVI